MPGETAQESDPFRVWFLEVRTLNVRETKRIRDVCKWVLDLLRNLINLGVLQYTAGKTGNFWVGLLYFIGVGAVSMYCSSYVLMFSPRRDLGTTPWARSMVYILLCCGFVLVFFAANFWLEHLVDGIAKSQMKPAALVF